MKKHSIKILLLLVLSTLFMSSCALEYQERNRRSRNWERGNDRYRRDRDRNHNRDYNNHGYYQNYNK